MAATKQKSVPGVIVHLDQIPVKGIIAVQHRTPHYVLTRREWDRMLAVREILDRVLRAKRLGYANVGDWGDGATNVFFAIYRGPDQALAAVVEGLTAAGLLEDAVVATGKNLKELTVVRPHGTEWEFWPTPETWKHQAAGEQIKESCVVSESDGVRRTD